MNWSYGVTTVPERRDTYLPATLRSLAAAGFHQPRLFVDGADVGYDKIGGPITHRTPRVGAWGNFILALHELYVREPVCERYALFQDDVTACRDLREYLERCPYPDGKDGREPGYWNLYTTLNSEWNVVDRGLFCGWIQGADMVNQPLPSTRLQCGRGALGLVFNREAVQIILGAPSAVGKPASADRPTHCIDGAVVTAMNLHRTERHPCGWREYVHGPSLLHHAGVKSVVEKGKEWTRNADSFRGEGWSALEMFKRG